MKNFTEIHDLYDDYIGRKKYNLGEFNNEYNKLSDRNKSMVDFILSKQDFFDKDGNNLSIDDMNDLLEYRGTVRDNGDIRKVFYRKVPESQYINENEKTTPDLNYNNPLNIAMSDAISSNNYEAVSILINKQGASKEFALYSAANYKNEGMIQRLVIDNKNMNIPFVVSSLEKESPENSKILSNVAFSSLAAVNNVEEMEKLRKMSNINVNVYNELPMRNAAANRNLETVNYLANLGASKETALHNLLKYNHNDLAYDFVEKNQDINFSEVKNDFKKEGLFDCFKKTNELEKICNNFNKTKDTSFELG